MAPDDGPARPRAGCRVSALTDAVTLWGHEVVERALVEVPPPMTPAFAREVAHHASLSRHDPHALARWALSLSWPRFVAVVHLVAGETRDTIMTPEH